MKFAFFCPGYRFAPKKINKIKAFTCLLKYESTQMDGTIIVFKLDCFFLFINEEQTKKKKKTSAICARHQFLLYFYIYFLRVMSVFFVLIPN